MTGDGHGLVERRDLEGDLLRDDLECHAANGVLYEEELRESALRTAASDERSP